MRVLFDERLAPLTLKTSERDGFDGIEGAFSGGVMPGSVRERFWELRPSVTGRFCSGFEVNSALTSARSDLSCAASAVITTVSLTCPTSTERSARVTVLSVTAMFSLVTVLKPDLVTLTV